MEVKAEEYEYDDVDLSKEAKKKSKDDDGSRLVGARAITSYKQEAPFLVAINPLRYDQNMTECST